MPPESALQDRLFPQPESFNHFDLAPIVIVWPPAEAIAQLQWQQHRLLDAFKPRYNRVVYGMRLTGYKDFSISRSGVLSQSSPDAWWGIHFKLDSDVSDLFPFINATVDDARLFDAPAHIQFVHESAQCTLYPREAIAAAFRNEALARAFADDIIALLNCLDARKASITPEFQPYKIISPVDIYKLLPGTNCGDCGFSTCVAFAATLGRGKAQPDQCPGFAKPLYHQAVYPVFDRSGNISATFSIGIPFSRQVAAKPSAKAEDAYQPNQTNLTKREIEVLRLLAQGATNNAISEKLFISPHTVKSHVIHIFNKLNVNDRTQAAVWATRHNIF